MSSVDLIARVAVDLIRRQIDNEPSGTLRFCMTGMAKKLVTRIAGAVLDDADLNEKLIIRVPSSLVDARHIPARNISNKLITHWRNHLISDDRRGILFAATRQDWERNQKSMEKVFQIQTSELRERHKSWIEQAQSGLSWDDNKAQYKQFEICLRAVNEAHVSETIYVFADYVCKIAEAISEQGLPVIKAADFALPVLHLPRNSCGFSRMSARKQGNYLEWMKRYRETKAYVGPRLQHENEKEEIITDVLIKNYEKIKEQLSRMERGIIEAFLDPRQATEEWSEEKCALIRLEWDLVSSIFKPVRDPGKGLHEKTSQFFKDEFDRLLGEEDEDILKNKFPRLATQELEKFFHSYQEQLSRNRRLYLQWERYIYKNPKPYDDFFVGLIDAIRTLRVKSKNVKIDNCKFELRIIGGNGGTQKSFWMDKNSRVARYFAFRYHGIDRLFADIGETNFGRLYDFYLSHPNKELQENTYTSSDTRQIKFEVRLASEEAKCAFVWEMHPDVLACSMPDDLSRIGNDGKEVVRLSTTNIMRQSVSTKGYMQRISLRDSNTIYDADGGSGGYLVNNSQDLCDQVTEFLDGLENIRNEGIINAEAYDLIYAAFNKFHESYTRAIREWIGPDSVGIASEHFISQANDYANLLNVLCKNSNNSTARRDLWSNILKIGIANVEDDVPAAIVTPWHPLRLAEIHIKAKQASRVIKKILDSHVDEFRDPKNIFISNSRQALISSYYPEVCICFREDGSVPLVESETVFDYTLASAAQRRSSEIEDALDIDSRETAQAFSEVGEEFLKLIPHEKSNFSVVLYDFNSKTLPGDIAKKITDKVEKDSALQCDLLLTHSDPLQMLRTYEQQNMRLSEDAGSLVASEAARNFLSRFRVGFLEKDAMTGSRSFDLVVLQDVIARNSSVVWKRQEPGKNRPSLADHVPQKWSRRCPNKVGDTTSAVYLAAPVQPEVVQNYLDFLHIFLGGEDVLSGSFIPAREIDFENRNVKRVLEDTHSMGEWVLNHDTLIDQRILARNNINVIRYIYDRNAECKTIVSTTAENRLLHVLLRETLDDMDKSIFADYGNDLIRKFTKQASELSGHVIMRAARYGRYSNELLGLVLSMQRIKKALGDSSPHIGWCFLDDHASWFGTSENKRADIMAIAPGYEENGEAVLKIAISEAKFVSSKGYRAEASKSGSQLRHTVQHINNALNESKLNREAWLDQIGKLMIEEIESFDAFSPNGWNLQRWAEEISRGNVKRIGIRGFSHVFVHDDNPEVLSDYYEWPREKNCTQEIINKSDVLKEIKDFANDVIDRDSTSSKGWTYPTIDEEPVVVRKDIESGAGIYGQGETGQAVPIPMTTENEHRDVPTVKELPATLEPGIPKAAEPSSQYNQWRSPELGRWANAGNDVGEEDAHALEWLEKTVKKLQRALIGYNMVAEILGSRLTPNAALVRFKGSNDLTIHGVEKKRQELLTSHALEVISVIAEPGEIVIVVKRPQRTILLLQDLWKQRRLPTALPDSNASLLLGSREDNGELLYLNVEAEFSGYQLHAPHTLIAGETGSGKGILLQNLLLDICATNSPANARIRMIDPKSGVDFPWLTNMPHLDGGLVTQREDAIEVFEMLVEEMERRNQLLAQSRVKDLCNYNKQVTPDQRLPRIWLFHDELADWTMDKAYKEYRDGVAANVTRLGMKARAAGINLVIVTQRPDKDALPMQLRANLANRLVLKVVDKGNSMLVLGEAGAEHLLGRGHLAAKLSGERQVVIHAQVPFADGEEISKLADLIAESWSGQSGKQKH